MYLLPKLKYNFDQLAPVIDAKTVEIHYTKHHQGYTDKLNAVLEGHEDLLQMDITELLSKIDELPEGVRPSVRNNGGGYSNHNIYWDTMTPGGNDMISHELRAAIKVDFGGVDALKEKLLSEAASRFGSGWAWLIVDANNNLSVISTPNQDSPYMEGITPILGVDVWEHAYYLNYQNRRPDYLEAWWGIIDWKAVSDRYAEALV